MNRSSQPEDAGQRLRALRHERGLTQHQLARLLSTSTAVLSRKERGASTLTRQDIRTVVQVFQLTPWEAFQLWAAAGLVPDQIAPPASAEACLHSTLPQLAFPAQVLNALGSLLGWNQAFDLLYQPRRLGIAPLHSLDLLLHSPPPLAATAEHYTRQRLALFAQQHRARLHQPAFLQLINDMAYRYGEQFVRPWQAVQQRGPEWWHAAPDVLLVAARTTRYGAITCLSLSSAAQVPPAYELVLLVPFGSASQAHYQQLAEQVAGRPGVIYHA